MGQDIFVPLIMVCNDIYIHFQLGESYENYISFFLISEIYLNTHNAECVETGKEFRFMRISIENVVAYTAGKEIFVVINSSCSHGNKIQLGIQPLYNGSIKFDYIVL